MIKKTLATLILNSFLLANCGKQVEVPVVQGKHLQTYVNKAQDGDTLEFRHINRIVWDYQNCVISNRTLRIEGAGTYLADRNGGDVLRVVGNSYVEIDNLNFSRRNNQGVLLEVEPGSEVKLNNVRFISELQ